MSNSAASESQLPAAASSEPDPGPLYIRPELISGGKKAKSIVSHLLLSCCAANRPAAAGFDIWLAVPLPSGRRAWHHREPDAVPGRGRHARWSRDCPPPPSGGARGNGRDLTVG